ncbi:MAG: nuclear transport factor 2 family protein [Flavobacteriales bacterium]|jgi:ketosteroid isomerase-like protein|tara:strand:- start:3952 stop:4338 length:387 start_codon:yes stop_codon:yes gene_type:complete
MTSETQVELVKRYFDAVDAENLSGLLDTLAPSCIFTVETHDVQLEGHAEISEMFIQLWADHTTILHHRFTHVPDLFSARVASRFMVQNTEHDGSVTHKSNCNFFEIVEGKFSTVRVYMTGENTLKEPQ